jgi:NAD dependent epimerase/dehydratase family enzyme
MRYGCFAKYVPKLWMNRGRVVGTWAVAEACAQLQAPPRVLVPGSTVGQCGDTGDRVIDENAPRRLCGRFQSAQPHVTLLPANSLYDAY